MKDLVSYINKGSIFSFYNDYKSYILGTVVITVLYKCIKKFYIAGGSCKSTKRLDGKTVIITGANTGLYLITI